MKKLVAVAMVALMLSVAVPVSASSSRLETKVQEMRLINGKMDLIFSDFVKSFLAYKENPSEFNRNNMIEAQTKFDQLKPELNRVIDEINEINKATISNK